MKQPKGTPNTLDEWIELGKQDPVAFMKSPLIRLYMATQPGWLLQQPLDLLLAIVGHPTACPASLIEVLSRKKGMPLMLRAKAAGRTDISEATIRRFSKQAVAVRAKLAANPNLPKDLERLFTKDKASTVREQIAMRTRDPALLNRLARDRSVLRVRVAVAWNEAIPEEARQRLAYSNCSLVQDGLKRKGKRSGFDPDLQANIDKWNSAYGM